MNNLKELLAKASRKCEMRWKVLVFDPNKDNELIDEFKDFECIDCATAKKRELLEKHPDKTIEIVSESISRKTEAGKEIKVGGQRFYTTNDNGIIFVRKIAPYDDADYYYAVYDPQKVRLVFTQSGGKNKQASMVKYNDTTKQLEEIAKKLIELNKQIQPKMVHESSQKNEGIEEQQDAIAKKIADALSAKFGWVLSKEGPYEEYYIGKGLNPINVKIKNDKDLQVQLRASERPKAFKSVKDAIDFIKSNMDAYGFPGGSAFYGKLQSKANKNVERQKARDTYLHDISDSAQKNEAGIVQIKKLGPVGVQIWRGPQYKKDEYMVALYKSDYDYRSGHSFFHNPKGKSMTKADAIAYAKKEWPQYEVRIVESAQMSETRGYRVLVELGVPDNMNNRDIEDEVERLLRTSHKINVVLDVTAERH